MIEMLLAGENYTEVFYLLESLPGFLAAGWGSNLEHQNLVTAWVIWDYRCPVEQTSTYILPLYVILYVYR